MRYKKQQSLIWNHVRQKHSESAREMHESAREMHESAREMHESARELHESARELHESAREMHESAGELHKNICQSINQQFSTYKRLKESSLHDRMLTYCNLKWDCGLSVGRRFVQQSLALRVFPIKNQTHGAGVSPALTQSWGQL